MSENTLSEEAFKEVVYYLKFGLKKDLQDAMVPVTRGLFDVCSELSNIKIMFEVYLDSERESTFN